jgi:hypothetical protein
MKQDGVDGVPLEVKRYNGTFSDAAAESVVDGEVVSTMKYSGTHNEAQTNPSAARPKDETSDLVESVGTTGGISKAAVQSQAVRPTTSIRVTLESADGFVLESDWDVVILANSARNKQTLVLGGPDTLRLQLPIGAYTMYTENDEQIVCEYSGLGFSDGGRRYFVFAVSSVQ